MALLAVALLGVSRAQDLPVVPVAPVAQAGVIQPPFGLHWGDSPGGLIDWAARFKLDVLVKALGDRPRQKSLIISPREGTLPEHESTSLEAHFIDGRLFEVSVHYTYPGKKTDFVKGRYFALKNLLTKHHGPLAFNGRKKEAAQGIETISEAYHVEPRPGNLLLLAMTEVRDIKRGDSGARFSLLYHNEDILEGGLVDGE